MFEGAHRYNVNVDGHDWIVAATSIQVEYENSRITYENPVGDILHIPINDLRNNIAIWLDEGGSSFCQTCAVLDSFVEGLDT